LNTRLDQSRFSIWMLLFLHTLYKPRNFRHFSHQNFSSIFVLFLRSISILFLSSFSTQCLPLTNPLSPPLSNPLWRSRPPSTLSRLLSMNLTSLLPPPSPRKPPKSPNPESLLPTLALTLPMKRYNPTQLNTITLSLSLLSSLLL